MGPVEVRLCCSGGGGAAGLGRGVFITEDVKAGQLLFATRHTAGMPLRGPFTTADGMELVTRLLDAVRAAQGKVARGARSFRDLQFLVQVHSMLGGSSAVPPGSILATNFAGRELCASGLGRLELDPKVEELVNRFGRITYGDGMDSRTYDNLLQCCHRSSVASLEFT